MKKSISAFLSLALNMIWNGYQFSIENGQKSINSRSGFCDNVCNCLLFLVFFTDKEITEIYLTLD